MRLAATLTLFLAANLWTTPANAGDGIWPELETLDAPVGMTPDGQRDAALVVALEDYAFLPDIPGATRNGVAWFRYFDQRGVPPKANVSLFAGGGDSDTVDADIVLNKIYELSRYVAETKGTFWIVFIGHGAPDPDVGDARLVMPAARANAQSLQARSIRRAEILGAISKDGAVSNAVLVLDTCFSGKSSADGGLLAEGLQPVLALSLASTDVVELLAAQDSQFAGPLPGTPRPAFSYLALGGLRGWADSDSDGDVSAAELIKYTSGAMSSLLAGKREQTPMLVANETGRILGHGRESSVDLVDIQSKIRLRRSAEPTVSSAGAGRAYCEQQVESKISSLQNDAFVRLAAPLQQKVMQEWADIKPKATACLTRRRDDREDCLEMLGDFLMRNDEVQVNIAGGQVDEVLTDCGVWNDLPYDAVTINLQVEEVQDAYDIMNRLRSERRSVLDQWTSPSTKYDMRLVKRTNFTMGCDKGCLPTEQPQFQVWPPHDIYVGTTEVTRDMWEAVNYSLPKAGTRCDAGSCPIESVTFVQAVAFANALSARDLLQPCYDIDGDSVELRTNKLDCEGYRLPTELEWEFLAKGGKNHRYSGGFDEAGRSGWVQVNSQKQAHQVAGKPANPFGLFDMTGNVAEWVWGGPFTYGKSAEVGPTNAKLMGVRGGSWDDEDAATRTDRRRFDKPKKPLSTVGFRLVRGAR